MLNSQHLVESIHKASGKGFVNFTGGGFRFLDALMGYGGGSNTLLGSLIPYETSETVDLLGFTPKGFCTPEVAEGLAMRAFEDAVINLTTREDSAQAFGLGFTASLAKAEEERPGRLHQFYLYGQTEDGFHLSISWSRPNDATPPSPSFGMNRIRQDQFLTDVAIAALYALKVDAGFDIMSYLRVQECYTADFLDYLTVEVSELELPIGPRQLLRQGIPQFVIAGEGFMVPKGWPSDIRAILPGSFNPYHSGHDEMRQTLSTMTGHKAFLELSLDNATKPSISWKSLKSRMESISSHFLSSPTGNPIPVIITRAPLFSHKMQVFTNVAWGMGYDTMVRFLDPKFVSLEAVREDVATKRARFIVFPRNGASTFPDQTPGWFQDRAVMVPGFNNPISSTELREVR